MLSMTDSPTRGMRWTEPGWRSAMLSVLLAAVGGALLPRRTRWLQWPYGLSRRGRLAHAAVTAALMFAVGEMAHRARERIAAELRDELGREPTSDEIHQHLQSNMARAALEEELGRQPTAQELRDFLDAR
jgi:hypothetical protein